MKNEEKKVKYEEFERRRDSYVAFVQRQGFTKEQAEFLFHELSTIKGILGIDFDKV